MKRGSAMMFQPTHVTVGTVFLGLYSVPFDLSVLRCPKSLLVQLLLPLVLFCFATFPTSCVYFQPLASDSISTGLESSSPNIDRGKSKVFEITAYYT